MANTTLSQELIYKKAGTFILIPYTNGVPDKSKQYVEAGVVDTIRKTKATTTVDMNDGNDTYPAHTYVTNEVVGYDITLNTYSPKLDAMLHGYTYLTGTDADSSMETIVKHNIGTDALDLTDTPPISVGDVLQIFVSDHDGTVFTSTTSDPSAGQFKFDTSAKTVTFASADAGKEVIVDVIYQGDNVVQIQAPETPTLPVFQVVILGDVCSANESQQYRTVSTIDRVSVANVTLPNQSNQPGGSWTFSLNAKKPRAGHKAHDLKIDPIG